MSTSYETNIQFWFLNIYNIDMEKKRIKDLKKGEYFTLKPIEFPKENMVLIRGEYERSSKKYSVTKFDDINHESFMKGDKMVYVDLIF